MYKPIIDHTSYTRKIIDFELGYEGTVLPYNDEFYFIKWHDKDDLSESIIKVSEGFYNNNNNKHGPHVYYYSDGNKKLERYYKDGRIHGKEIAYLRKGHIHYTNTYDEGILHGETIIMNEKDNLISRRLHYKYGKLHGTQEVYFKGIKTHTIDYQNGLKDGIESKYDLEGKLMARIQWKQDKKNGNYNEYHSNGGLRFVCQFCDDVLNGPLIEIDTNGKQISRKTYVNGIELTT